MTRLSNYYRVVLLLLTVSLFGTAELRAQCTINATPSSLEGCAPYDVNFEVSNSNGKTQSSWAWDFGDGKTSTQDKPAHQYARGTWTATVTVTFSDGTTCTATYGPIKVFDNPVADFQTPSGVGTGAIQCYQVNGKKNKFCFKNLSKPGKDNFAITKLIWNFGDGDTLQATPGSPDENPCHSYDSFGKFKVTLYVFDTKGCRGVKSAPIDIQVLKDVLLPFTASGASGCFKSTFTFKIDPNDTQNMWLDKWYWDFGDGSPIDSVTWSPSHTYYGDSTYTVRLVAKNKLGCEATYVQKVTNQYPKLKVKYQDSICWVNNNILFEAEEMKGATFWQWTFDDPPSGPNNKAAYSWKASHKFVSGPKNYQVKFHVEHPCKTFDTCIVVHLKGPQAIIHLKPMMVFNNYYPAKRIPLSDYTAINTANNCGKSSLKYVTFTKTSKTVNIPYYCNADTISTDTGTIAYCDGYKKHGVVLGVHLKATSVTSFTYTDSVESAVKVWNKGDPIPAVRTYYPSSGNLIYQTMHDSDFFTCTMPDMVRFTNNSVKYRLQFQLDNTPFPTNMDTTTSLKDICKYKNWPFASDSMQYLWSFNDPAGLPCTSSVSANTGNLKCNYSTLVAPTHFFSSTTAPATGCQPVQFTVTDPVTGCTDQTTFQIGEGKPDAWWQRTGTALAPNRYYCGMNWDAQQILPPAQVSKKNGNPRRGFMMGLHKEACTSEDYPLRLDFSEIIPAGCGPDDWWAVFDSAAATKVSCVVNGGPQLGKKYYDYGFNGSANPQGWPIGNNSSVWNNIPWFGNYWYMQGDSGCKTVGIVVKQGDCYDTAWYHNYICFNKLNPLFTLTDTLKGANHAVDPSSSHMFDISSSALGEWGHTRYNQTIKPGIRVMVTPRRKDMVNVTKFKFTAQRLEFPGGDYYYTMPFWPDSMYMKFKYIYDKFGNKVDSNFTYPFFTISDSVTSRQDKWVHPADSLLWTYGYDNATGAVVDTFPVTDPRFAVKESEMNQLNKTGKFYLKIKSADPRARTFAYICGLDSVPVIMKNGPFVAKDTAWTVLMNDPTKDDTKFFVDANNNYKVPIHDTIRFDFPYPGIYRIIAEARDLNGCIQATQYNLIYGHFARFTVKGGDSTICVGDTVQFEYLIRYWSSNCPAPPGLLPPDFCIDGLLENFTKVLTPWDVPDPEAQRLAFDNKWKKPVNYQNETFAWNFGDNSIFYPFATGSKIIHKYTKPGIFTVTMRTTSWDGVTINTVRRNLIAVIGLKADFAVHTSQDTLRFCVPQDINFKDRSGYQNNPLNDPKKFGYHQPVLKKGRIVDSVFIRDSIISYRWDPGNGTDPIIRTKRDTSLFFHYTEGGKYTISLNITNANKPKACVDKVIKKDYIRLLGPKPRFEFFDSTKTSGCVVFSVLMKNLNSGNKNAQSFNWDLGDGSTFTSRQGEDTVRLTYKKAGKYKITMLESDTVYNPFLGKQVSCAIKWPPDTAAKQFWVTVYPHAPLKITGPTRFCANTPKQFTAAQNGGDMTKYTKYQWDFGDGAVQNTTDSFASHSYSDTGHYTIKVTGTSDHGCTESATYQVYVEGLKVDFAADTSSQELKDKANIANYTLVNNSRQGVKYTWDFGDGSPKVETKDSLPVNHTFTNFEYKDVTRNIEGDDTSFTFKVCLTGENKAGCTITTCHDIKVIRTYKRYNVITPDNDGKNDKFDPRIKGETEYDIIIFNRWGEKVFESTDSNVDWDGSYNNSGKPCPAGTYYYVLKYKLIGGKGGTDSGTVTVIR